MKEKEAEKGIALAPDEKDLRPWYTTSNTQSEEKMDKPIKAFEVDSEESALVYKEQQRKLRAAKKKTVEDPLIEMNAMLKKRHDALAESSTSSSRQLPPPVYPPIKPSSTSTSPGSALVNERLSREASERARAQALIRARQRALEGSDVASSIGDGTPLRGKGYGDVYNRQETLEAGRRRHDWGHFSDPHYNYDSEDRYRRSTDANNYSSRGSSHRRRSRSRERRR
ncbi:hypothetical protein FRB99_008520 [Tulasnella sp. 403]|nr:hypothetical protein FRB99_008520 [Tulasnella sp. 403]